MCVSKQHFFAIIRGRCCRGIDQFPTSSSPFLKTLQSKGDGGMGPCVPLSYTSDGGVARICQRGMGAKRQFLHIKCHY